jgi:hypothetical protein
MNSALYDYLHSYIATKQEGANVAKYDTALKAASSFLEKNIGHDFLLPIQDAESSQLSQERIERLNYFFDKTITISKGSPQFSSAVAWAVKATIFDPVLSREQEFAIYESPENLGIREKYLKGQLDGKHWLTDLDLLRMLECMELKGKVRILPFTKESIAAALDLTKEGIEKHTEEHLIKDDNRGVYTIPFILNYSKDKKGSGAHWVAAQVFYHPVSGEISYRIDDSVDLTEERREQYKGILEDAIENTFKRKILVNEDNQIVPKSSISMIGHPNQDDSYSCGYRALHYLLKEIKKRNQLAEDYAGIANSKDLVTQFFTVQLQNLHVPYDIYRVFARPEQFAEPLAKNPSMVELEPKKLERFLKTLQMEPFSPQLMVQAVAEGVGAYSPGLPLNFPSDGNKTDLDHIQYAQYFTELNEAVSKSGIPIPTLYLSSCDNKTLTGLNNFLATSDTVPFRVLQINIDSAAEDADFFVKNLQLALSNLSRHQRLKLQIVDPFTTLNSTHYKNLQDFIEKKGIAIQIELPPSFQETDCQRQIDKLTALNLRNKNNSSLKVAALQAKEVIQQKKDRPIRSRPDTSLTKNLNIDVEMQADVEETIVFTPGEIEKGERKQYGDFQKLTLADLTEAIKSNEDNAFANFADIAGGLSKVALVEFWHALSGNTVGTLGQGLNNADPSIGNQIANFNQQFHGFTKSALARLVKYKSYFNKRQDGINIDQLPLGFILIPDPSNPKTTLLHYDPASAVSAPASLLAPFFIDATTQYILSIDTTEKLLAVASMDARLKTIWTTLQQKDSYPRKSSEVFRRLLPQLLTFNSEQLENLISLCGGTDNFNYNTLAFIFENLEQAKLAYTEGYDERSLVSIEWMRPTFPEFKDRKDFVTLAHSLISLTADEHVLFTLLQVDAGEDLSTSLRNAVRDYGLTARELNGLLGLYDKYGSSSLEILLNKWDTINRLIPLKTLSPIVKNTAGYEAFLFDNEVLQAVEAINQFDPNKKQWWNKLFETHVPKEDDFLAVYKCFNAFASAIESYGLTFYGLKDNNNTPLFKGAGNLPATVGRMLSILNLCRADDRVLQWQAISKIDLSSRGALGLIADRKGKECECGFVLPEMNFDSDNRAPSPSRYSVRFYLNEVTAKTLPAEVDKGFYSYLAYESNRFPLAFYKEAKAKIDQTAFPLEAKRQLYALLLAATTGDNYRFERDVNAAMVQFDSIINEISDVKVSIPAGADKIKEKVQKIAIDELFSLTQTPSLPVLARLVKLTMAPLHKISSSDLAGAPFGKSSLAKEAKALEEYNNRLEVLLKAFGKKIYLGMRFYTDTHYQQAQNSDSKNLFAYHLDVSEAISKSGSGKYLLEQVSSFNIKKEQVQTLSQAIKFATAKKITTKVYPQNHELAGQEIPPSEKDQHIGVLRPLFGFSHKQSLFNLSAGENSFAHLLYRYPQGHEKGSQFIPEIIRAELKAVRLYPQRGEDNDGQIIPDDVDAATIPEAIEAWAYFYPEGHVQAGERCEGLEIFPTKEQVPAAPVLAVLREVYFYPQGHAQAGQPVPFTEAQPLGAVIKVAYYDEPSSQEKSEKIIANEFLAVKEVRAQYLFQEGQRKGREDFFCDAELKTPAVYPEGHSKAGQFCDYFIEESFDDKTQTYVYRQSWFANQLFNYAFSFLKDIEQVKKSDGSVLTPEDLQRFIFALSEKFEGMVEFLDRQHAIELLNSDKIQKEINEVEELMEVCEEEELVELIQKKIALMQRKSNHEDMLEKVWEGCSKAQQEELLNFVEETFGAHFPKDYFARLRAGEAKPEVQLLINQSRAFIDGNIRELVQALRQHYNSNSVDNQIELVLLLEAICSTLSHSDKLELLQFLNNPKLTETTIAGYLLLLKAIHENGPSSFIYFCQSAEKFVKPVSNLADKATYFLTHALPQIRKNESKLLGEMDVINLVIDTLLAANANELSSEFDIDHLLTNAYSQLYKALNEPKSAEEIEQAVDNLATFVNIADIKGMSELQAHLIWLKNVEMETYVISPAPNVSTSSGRGFFQLASKLTTALSSIWTQGEKQEIIAAKMGQRQKQKNVDPKILSTLATSLDLLIKENKTYTHALSKTFAAIQSLVEKYPGAKKQILAHCRHHLSFNTTGGSQIEATFKNIDLIKREFEALNDQNLVLGLCEHFDGINNSNPADLNFTDLLNIFKGVEKSEGVELKTLRPSAKRKILIAVNALLNNDKPCSRENIQELITQCSEENYGKLYEDMLELAFKNAPFPSFEKLNGWFEAVTQNSQETSNPTALKRIEEQYLEWSRAPVQREAINGFNLEDAKKQNALIRQLNGFSEDFYSIQELEKLDQAVKSVRNFTTEDIITTIQNIRANEELQNVNRQYPTELVALMAELLYRTKGLEAVFKDGQQEWGRSFEINTTQYLALYSMLRADTHITTEIATGEGKSRIMMLANACKYALGSTGDFVTEDVTLATRDYLEYQAFFKSFGAETRMITATMPAEQYKLNGGIHFTDPKNLSLFRNKARNEGKWDLVIEKNPKKRALTLDEADKIFFDCVNTRYNYSAQANPLIRDMEWIYELMVDFFTQDETNRTLYRKDAEACNIAFINFARGKLDGSPEKMARLEFNKDKPMPVIPRNQLEAWQTAALTALDLKLGEDFTIIQDVVLQTKQGPRCVSQAQIRADGRANGAAKFSFGVHQCLHARLNKVKAGLLKNDPLTQEQHLGQVKIDQLKHPFYIDPETQIVYSSTSKSMLDLYDEGDVLAVTGTAGSILEQEEAAKAYSKKTNSADQDRAEMTFVKMPRHCGQNRMDYPYLVANDEGKQQQKILRSILDSLEKNQPILLVCKDDNESALLQRFLKHNLTAEQQAKLARISAETKLEDEAKHIKNNAGQPGAITVSTSMVGRGTDIGLHGEAKKHGLNVIVTYLPRERDYWQIVGRAGRFGAKGQSQLILNKERVAKQIKHYMKRETVPVELYTATEDYLKSLQERMDTYEQYQRLVKNVVNDFRLSLTNKFFDHFKAELPSNLNKDEWLGPWQQFIDKSDKLWNACWPTIQSLLWKEKMDIKGLNQNLVSYQQQLQAEWGIMQATFKTTLANKVKEEVITQNLVFNDDPNLVVLPENVIVLLAGQDEKQQILQTPVAEKYHPAFVGRAVVYTNAWDNFKSFFQNIAAAWRGEGLWFPNLKAWLNKNISTSQFFFGSWGRPLEIEVFNPPAKVYKDKPESHVLLQTKLTGDSHPEQESSKAPGHYPSPITSQPKESKVTQEADMVNSVACNG